LNIFGVLCQEEGAEEGQEEGQEEGDSI